MYHLLPMQRRERFGRLICQRTVRTLLVVMLAKLRQLLLGVVQRREPLYVQTLIGAGPNETQLHLVSRVLGQY